VRRIFMLAIGAAVLAVGANASAAEIKIGQEVEKNFMEITAVYLQAVTMEPADHAAHGPTDIHLEADIRGAKDDPNGFGPGEWVPYLGVAFSLAKQGSSWTAKGELYPMVANDGPHYGANVKLEGPGKYKLAYRISPPGQGFMRHTDKETGVAPFWEPFTVEWEFTYVGVGKKGGY